MVGICIKNDTGVQSFLSITEIQIKHFCVNGMQCINKLYCFVHTTVADEMKSFRDNDEITQSTFSIYLIFFFLFIHLSSHFTFQFILSLSLTIFSPSLSSGYFHLFPFSLFSLFSYFCVILLLVFFLISIH